MFDSGFVPYAKDPIVEAIATEAARREHADDEQWKAIERLADAYQGLLLKSQWWSRRLATVRAILLIVLVLGGLQFIVTSSILLRLW